MSITQPIHLNGVTGGAVNLSPCSSRSDGKRVSQIKILSLNCASRSMSCVCNASSGSYRRNPDFPKQNKQGFSRSRNKHFEDKDGSDNLEDSEIFSSKNGGLHSVSGSPKYQATAAPGPREKEIVELFRKVQAQLRERAAIKEEKKIEEPQVQVKKNETVDSLLKLLRKHSVQQGKRGNSSSGSGDFILDQPELNGSFSTGKSSSFFKSNNDEKSKVQESEASSVGRPMSSFRRRSPVPQIKKQPTYVDEDTVSSITHTNQEGKQKDTSYLEHEVEHKPILKLKVDPVVHDDSQVESDSAFPIGDLFGEMSDGETTETDEDADEQNMSKDIDLSGMKLVELRALAKSRGMKGFSKLKKQDLIQLLAAVSV